MITQKEARKLFDEVASSVRKTEELIEKIISEQAWVPLGYERLWDAWRDLLGDTFVGSRRLRTLISIEFVRSGFDYLDPGSRGYLEGDARAVVPPARGVSGDGVKDVRMALNAGVYPDRIVEWVASGRTIRNLPELAKTPSAETYHRGSHEASYPEPPYRVTVEFTHAERERFQRIAEARSSTIADEARLAINMRFDALERDLSVSV